VNVLIVKIYAVWTIQSHE